MPSSPAVAPGERPIRHRTTVLLGLLLLVLLPGTVLVLARQQATAIERQRFAVAAERAATDLERRVQLYAQTLAGAGAFVLSSQDIKPAEWATYVQSVAAGPAPAPLGLGWAPRVASADLTDFAKRAAAEGITLRTASNRGRAEAFPIMLFHPRSSTSEQLGYDFADEPKTAAAIAQALTSGQVVISEPAPLPSGRTSLMLLPIFPGGSLPPEGEARRRSALGLVFAVLPLDTLVAGIIDGTEGIAAIDLHGEDEGAEEGDAKPLAAAGKLPSAYTRGVGIPRTLAGRHWLIEIHSSASSTPWPLAVPWLLAGGAFALGGLGMLLFLQFRERQSRAQRIANRMTTDLRATQDELRAALSQSQEAAKTKGEFLAVMSHELRTPLNGVIGMTSLLLDSGLDTQQRDFAETARSCANGLLDIINDILDYSKLEAGKIQVESLPFDPHDLVEEVLQVVADRAQAKNLVLVGEVDPRVGDRLRGDPSRVRQLLLNLMSNAVKFTERGEVVLSMRLAHDDETTPRIRLEVRDSGIGIPAEHLDGLFRPFTQADSSISRRFGGTGLGLAICKRLAEALGGTISVSSTVGKGSVFAAELPFRREEPSDTSEPPTELVGRLVLIIDPHPISRAATAAILGDFGCEVLAVASIDLAGQALGEAVPDLIVSDTGRDPDPGLVAALRAIPVRRGAEVPVLLLVPFSFALRPDEPGVAVVTKPVRRRSLRDAAQALLRGVPNTGSTRTPRRFAGLSVLVADERLGNLRILSALLTELGCRVDLAADTDETVAAAKRVDYAVIILAADLPPRGAADTASTLRQVGSRATLIASGTETLPAGCHATMRSTPRAAVLARLLTQAALNR